MDGRTNFGSFFCLRRTDFKMVENFLYFNIFFCCFLFFERSFDDTESDSDSLIIIHPLGELSYLSCTWFLKRVFSLKWKMKQAVILEIHNSFVLSCNPNWNLSPIGADGKKSAIANWGDLSRSTSDHLDLSIASTNFDFRVMMRCLHQ